MLARACALVGPCWLAATPGTPSAGSAWTPTSRRSGCGAPSWRRPPVAIVVTSVVLERACRVRSDPTTPNLLPWLPQALAGRRRRRSTRLTVAVLLLVAAAAPRRGGDRQRFAGAGRGRRGRRCRARCRCHADHPLRAGRDPPRGGPGPAPSRLQEHRRITAERTAENQAFVETTVQTRRRPSGASIHEARGRRRRRAQQRAAEAACKLNAGAPSGRRRSRRAPVAVRLTEAEQVAARPSPDHRARARARPSRRQSSTVVTRAWREAEDGPAPPRLISRRALATSAPRFPPRRVAEGRQT